MMAEPFLFADVLQRYAIRSAYSAGQLAQHRLRSSYPDGVLWAESGQDSSMAILSTMAHGYGLNVTPYQDLASRARVVRQLLANKQFLLVLDDVQSSAAIAEILPTAPRCSILLTSQRRDLAVGVGGTRIEIPPFTTELGEANLLFAQILQRELGQVEKENIEQMSNLLGGLPLALAIAASRLAYEPGWHLPDLLFRLQSVEQRCRFLAYEALNVQQSFAFSLGRLPKPLQSFLVELAIFNGRSFTDTAAANFFQLPVTAVQDNLRTLYNHCLVQSQTGAEKTCYSLHPLLNDCLASSNIKAAKPTFRSVLAALS